ncbi:MAG: NAD-dependent epimerase/dehydratase family protein [Porticoccaceae bacterium]
MSDSPRVLVLGGEGFIGRHAVAELRKQNINVVVGTRDRSLAGKPGYECYFLEQRTKRDDWREVVRRFDVILNCVGILRPAGSASYEDIHHLAPGALVEACAEAAVRFIHVSALGLSPGAKSGFLRSKLAGEAAIQATAGEWIIVRPSLLDGEGGYGAAWLRGVSKLPVFAVPADAKGQIAALTANDLGEALTRLCLASKEELKLDESRIFELGGNTHWGFEAYIRGLRRRYTEKPVWAIPIPGILSRIGAHLCDVFRVTPFSFGHWELLRKNNIPLPNRLPELLGRPPTEVISPLPSSSLPIS